MSRIGKQPVIIPSGVKVEQKGQHLKVTGPLGNLEMDCHPSINIKVDSSANSIVVENDHTAADGLRKSKENQPQSAG